MRDQSVPVEVVRGVLEAVERCGHDPRRLTLPTDLRPLSSVRGRVSWAVFESLVESVQTEFGADGLAVVSRQFAHLSPSLRWLGSLLLPPRHFFRALTRAGAAWEGWKLTASVEGREATVVVELREGRWSAAVIEALRQVVIELGVMLGGQAERLDVRQQGEVATLRWHLPRGRAFTLKTTEPQLAAVVDGLLGRESVRGATPTMEALEEKFGLTRAESRIVRRLAAGKSLAEIAEELAVGTETVRTHAKRAMQKTNTHRQAALVALVLGQRADDATE